MSRILRKTFGAGRLGTSKNAVGEKRVRDSEGHVKVLRTLDLSSKTFGTDLEYVFKRNVAKIRRENKRLLGVADFAPAKR